MRGRVALLFPGQGSQSVGMLGELAEAHPIIEQTFAQASEIMGQDLWALASDGPAEAIRQTEITQPLMYTSGVALFRLWNEVTSLHPVAMAGHSLGEFCALTAAGAIEFAQCLPVVVRRAQLMANAVKAGEGGMAAILGLDDDAVVEICHNATSAMQNGHIVEAVNFNSPAQVVISGHVDAVSKACELARDNGAKKAVMLPVSVPNHSSLMQTAGEDLAGLLDQQSWTVPAVPVIQNTYAKVAQDVDDMLASLKQHVSSPVQWTRSYQQLLADFKPDAVVELGPGKVLAGLGKRIERSMPVSVVYDLASLQKTQEFLQADP